MRGRRHRAVWVIALLIATCATIAGLWTVTTTVRDLEERQVRTLDDIARAEAVRLALWRMDSWMTPRLAREAARPIAEYSAFYAPSGTVNRLLQSVPKGEVLSPSPLLISTPDWIPIYFETQEDGTLTSPQIPQGNLLDLASGKYLSAERLEQREKALATVAALIGAAPKTLEACAVDAEVASTALGDTWRAPPAASAAASPVKRQSDAKSDEPMQLSRRDRKKDQMDSAAPATKGGFAGGGALRGGGAGGGGALGGAGDEAGANSKAISDLATRAKASNEAQTGAQQAQTIVDEQIQREEVQYDAQSRKKQSGPPPPLGRAAQTKAGVVEDAAGAAADAAEADTAKEQSTVVSSTSSIGPFVPAWLSTAPPQLMFVRRVREHGIARLQGFLVDWPMLSTHLVAQITDLAIDPRLVPTSADSGAFGPARLASIPADLVADSYVTAAPAQIASSAPAVRFAWAAAILALVGAGAAAVAGVSFGDRQARFASSVTHELRTPLTTFQLYAEMLRDDMIPDPARRQECLATLCRESKRLSHLVENVLSLARVERGATSRKDPTRMDSTELVSVIRAIAAERAGDSALTVDDRLDGASVRVDHDALSQIIANLLENAAKYGRAGDGTSAIEISLSHESGSLVIAVTDRGPGVTTRQEAAIWRPFDRAGAEGSNQPGLGLGLAVSRALAEGMGGTLRLARASTEQPVDHRAPGARFELRIRNAVIGG